MTSEVFLWICFFCNNQYRILESATDTGPDELKEAFESNLAKAGRMLILLDSFERPAYITRLAPNSSELMCLKLVPTMHEENTCCLSARHS